MWTASAPVVVGVDGSDAAIDAAKWAIDEAISRDVALRIVHVTHIQRAGLTRGHVPPRSPICRIVAARRDRRRGGEWETRQDRNRNPVGLAGHRSDQRVAKRFHGVIGSVGIGAVASKMWGSTAATLADKAYCPVAIIRSPHNSPATGPDWIVVVVEDHADNESVIEHAMNEARLRTSPVLAVGVWEETSAKLLTTNWTAGSKLGRSFTPTSASIRWPPGPVSLGSWPITRTNRCS